tara:strand:- start:2003 stop:3547 length:1545 start_codon:yes stop_codon:yes gene_type:complete
MIDNDITFANIRALSGLIKDKEISPVELISIFLEKIEKLNPALSAFITIANESAYRDAQQVEKAIMNGEHKGMLHGIPIALKDNIFTNGVLTTAATPGLKEYIPNYSATCWQNFEDAGSILIGKTMLHEYAIAASLWSDGYGAARNPWDQVKTTNGSSSGSAAAVAAGLSTVGIGTETGASVRRPASFCGLVSMLGTYGRISRYGVIPNSWSLDHVGIMTREVDDAQIVYEAIAGHDHNDPTSLQQDIYSNKNLTHKSNDLIGAIMWDHIEGSVDEDVLVAMKEAVQILQDAGVKIIEMQSSALDFAALTSSVMMKSEVTAAHSHALQLSPEKYSDSLRTLLLAGQDNKTEDYLLALQARRLIHNEVKGFFDDIDFIIAPTTATVATNIVDGFSAMRDRPFEVGGNWHNLHRVSSLLGLPTISLPHSLNDDGLPTSVQFIFDHYEEKKLFEFSKFYRLLQPWDKKPLLEYDPTEMIKEKDIDKGGQVKPDPNFLHQQTAALNKLVTDPFTEPMF